MQDAPAFPHPENANEDYWPGLTLRDYFAAKAMQAWLVRGRDNGDVTAQQAYAYADAMLRARDGK